MAAGKEIRPFAGSAGQVRALAVAPDGKTVASAGVDRRIHLWDSSSGQERRSLEGSDDTTVALLGFSPDGRSLTAVGRGGGNSVLVWDAADGKKRSAFSLAEKHFGSAFALSPDAALVAAQGGPEEMNFRFRRAEGRNMVRRQDDGRAASVGALLDGTTLAVFRRPDSRSTRYGSLLLWDAVAGAGDAVTLKSDIGSVFCASPRPTASWSPRPGRAGS